MKLTIRQLILLAAIPLALILYGWGTLARYNHEAAINLCTRIFKLGSPVAESFTIEADPGWYEYGRILEGELPTLRPTCILEIDALDLFFMVMPAEAPASGNDG